MNRGRLLVPVLLTLLAPGLASGDDSGAPAAESYPLELKTPTGRFTDAFNGFTQRIRGYNTYQERLDLEVGEDVSKPVSDSTTYAARLMPWAWWRMPEAVGGAPRPYRAQFELKEGWIERTSAAWDLRLGNQIVSWGAADAINPTDVWNPHDLYDPFQSYKLPLLMAKLKVHPPETETFALEAIFAPFFRPSQLPAVLPGSANQLALTDSRWLLPVPSTLSAGNGGLVAPLIFSINPPTYPVSWQAGGRLQIQRLGGWDFSLSYYNGVESTPRIAFSQQGSATSASLPVTISLYPSFHREQMFGVDGSGSVTISKHDFGTRFEFAYYKRDNSRAYSAPVQFQSDLIKDDYVHGVAGFDYTVPTSILGTVLYGNLQYVFYQRIGNKESQPGATIITGLPDTLPWDSDIVLYLEDRIGSTFKLMANTLYSAANGDAYESPSAQYSWTDNFKTTLSGDFFLGARAGFFGQFYDNRRINLVASYVF